MTPIRPSVVAFPPARRPLYTLQERMWHWIQALLLLILAATGFSLHYPDRLLPGGAMATAAAWHTGAAVAVILNMAVGLLYHLTSGRFRHLLPMKEDFTSAALNQLRYYLYGVFKGERHPLENASGLKMNPMAKFAYLMLLDVLVPWQTITGILIWAANRWPDAPAPYLDLRWLGPAHALGAFLFAAFLVDHLYFTTTGKTPFSLLRAMVTGYEEKPPDGPGPAVPTDLPEEEEVPPPRRRPD